MRWEVGDSAYPVLIGDVDGDGECPQAVEVASKDLLAPAFDQSVSIGVAEVRIPMEPLSGHRPESTAKTPAR